MKKIKDRQLSSEFVFKNFSFLSSTGVLSLEYEVDGSYNFKEEIVFPNAPFFIDQERECALNNVFRLLHIAAGISYYKAFLPKNIKIEKGSLTKNEAEFFNQFYINGLGEFAVRNNVYPFDNIKFPYKNNLKRDVCNFDFGEGAFVPVGGGKDSCLTLELVDKLGIDVEIIACGCPKPIANVIKKSKKTSCVITRKIDPFLMELNKQGKVYNGHVPITGILAFVLWAAAILNNKKYVVMSCERSASSGNMKLNNIKINHQYSKSFDFEYNFRKITKTITPKFAYFSLLRPISEIHIAKLFTQKCQKYFDVFTSCNKAFRLDENTRLNHWCGNCDKCRFVFLALAPFMNKEKLVEIVGNNPLDDMSQLQDYQKLLGQLDYKPFECVGEFVESNWALTQLQKMPEWQDDCLVKLLKAKVYKKADKLFIPNKKHIIPKRFSDVMEIFTE